MYSSLNLIMIGGNASTTSEKNIVVVILTLFCFSGPQPLICCPPSGPQVCPPRAKPTPPLPSRKRKRSHTTADCREKQTCGKTTNLLKSKKKMLTQVYGSEREGLTLITSPFYQKKYLFYLHIQAMIKHIWIGPLGGTPPQILPIRSDSNKTLCL